MTNTEKAQFKKEFKKAFPDRRLLAIHLDGFTHSVVFDYGDKTERPQSEHWSAYTDSKTTALGKLLSRFGGHGFYKHNPQEIIFVQPNKR